MNDKNKEFDLNNAAKWRKLVSMLMEAAEENRKVLDEIKEQAARQKEKNRQEVQELMISLSAQQAEMENLLTELKDDELLALYDEQVLSNLIRPLNERIEKTKELFDYAGGLIGTDQDLQDSSVHKSRSEKEHNATFVPKLFRKEHILGNWVHYFNDDTFTCQSFWDDGSFKEYDFQNGRSVGEREGLFEIEDGKLTLLYGEGKADEYQITGFSDERIDYLISGSSIQFDYMPESLLNNLLDADLKQNGKSL